MSKNSIAGAACLLIGLACLYFGYQAQQGAGSQVEEFFNGTPSDEAMFLLIGGGVATLVGLGLLGVGLKGKKG